MDSNKLRRNRSRWIPICCCMAVPLLSVSSYVVLTMRYLHALDLHDRHDLKAALVGFGPSAIDSAKKHVEKVVADLGFGGNEQPPFKFCETNLPNEVESLDDIEEFNINVDNVVVCVVLVAFERKDYLNPVLGSILNQTHQHLEVVAVDNGSSDGSKEVLLKVSEKHKNIRVIHLDQHTTEGQSYNIGINKCSSRSAYVLLNDGSVTLEKDAVASMLSYAENLRADVVLADFDVLSAPGGRTLNEANSYDANQWNLLPTGSPFNVYSEPNVLRIAPMSSRKLYRLKSLLETTIDFPEGHFESADEAFHWRVLTHATRISKLDRILFHRMKTARPNPLTYASFFSNAHHVGKMLFGQNLEDMNGCLPSLATTGIAERYFQWIDATGWISTNQQSVQMQDKFDRLLKQAKHHWPQRSMLPQAYWESLSGRFDTPLRDGPSPPDLTIIIPTYNVKDFIGNLLKAMYASLEIPGFSFEVFAIDDGSDDGTIKVLQDFQKEHASNFFVMKTPSSNGGAGIARNVAIPLIEGRYVYFVDADDGYDFDALAESVSFATVNEYDLLILPYETETVGPNNNITTTAMMNADQQIWEKLPSETNRTHEMQKEAAYGLINYPWKQLTSSRIMQDDDIFFGPTKVHNDVQFHWTSIAASKNLHFYHKKVCSHRTFDASVRGQLTAVKSAARMNVFDAIALAHRALARQGAFDGGEREGYAFEKWLKFSRDVLNWASKRVPTELEGEYKARWKFTLDSLKDERLQPSKLRDWPYWESRFAKKKSS